MEYLHVYILQNLLLFVALVQGRVTRTWPWPWWPPRTELYCPCFRGARVSNNGCFYVAVWGCNARFLWSFLYRERWLIWQGVYAMLQLHIFCLVILECHQLFTDWRSAASASQSLAVQISSSICVTSLVSHLFQFISCLLVSNYNIRSQK
jgi:hypothetical protein